MPNARFRLTNEDIIVAAGHNLQMAARENPIYSFIGFWGTYALLGAGMFWIVDTLFQAVFGWRSELGLGAVPAVVLLGFMQARARTRPSLGWELGQFRRNPMAHAWLDIPWSEAGIDCDPQGLNPLAWRKLEKWSEVDGMMLIYFRPKIFAILPRRALTDEERGLMRGYLEAAQVPSAGKPWWR